MQTNSPFEALMRAVFVISGASEKEIAEGIVVVREFLYRKSLDNLISQMNQSDKKRLVAKLQSAKTNEQAIGLIGEFYTQTQVLAALEREAKQFAEEYIQSLVPKLTSQQKEKLLIELKTFQQQNNFPKKDYSSSPDPA